MYKLHIFTHWKKYVGYLRKTSFFENICTPCNLSCCISVRFPSSFLLRFLQTGDRTEHVNMLVDTIIYSWLRHRIWLFIPNPWEDCSVLLLTLSLTSDMMISCRSEVRTVVFGYWHSAWLRIWWFIVDPWEDCSVRLLTLSLTSDMMISCRSLGGL